MKISEIKSRIESEIDLQTTLSSTSYPTLSEVEQWIGDKYVELISMMPVAVIRNMQDRTQSSTNVATTTINSLLGLSSNQAHISDGTSVMFFDFPSISSSYLKTFSVRELTSSSTTSSYGSSIYATGKGVFNSDTESWVAESGITMTQVSGELKFQQPGLGSGRLGYVYLDTNGDLASDLEQYNEYIVNFEAYSDMDNPYVVIYDSSDVEVVTLSIPATVKTSYSLNFIAKTSTGMKLGVKNTDTLGSTTSFQLDNITVKKVTRSHSQRFESYQERENLKEIDGNSFFIYEGYFENTADGNLAVKMAYNQSSNNVSVRYVKTIDPTNDNEEIPDEMGEILVLMVRSMVEYKDEDFDIYNNTIREIEFLLKKYGIIYENT